MFVRHFLVVFKEFPIDRTAVRSGQVSQEVVTACRCVNIGLFVSGDLRRDVTVSIAIGQADDMRVISFPGAKLRRVSPDERSISFFLLKAVEKMGSITSGDYFEMDNGIGLTRVSLDEFIRSSEQVLIQVPSFNPERFILDANLSSDRSKNTT